MITRVIPKIVFLYGPPAAGKTTIARAVARRLALWEHKVEILDGDEVRRSLFRELGFSAEDRAENIRRTFDLACRFARHGVIVIVAMVAPLDADRALARAFCQDLEVLEVLVWASLEIRQKRDPKGLYAQARAGTLKDLSGYDGPFEPPADRCDLSRLDTGLRSLDECLDTISQYFILQSGVSS